jgi:endo-1,4-beta-xylanase
MDTGAADWRSEASQTVVERARANIPKLRQRSVELRVVDRRGQPSVGTELDVVQIRAEFPVGDQLWALDRLARFGGWEQDRARYLRARHAELLNAATALCYWTERPRNDGPKTEDRQGEPRYEEFARCVEWAAAQGMTVKGHPLFWSIPKCVPEWVQRYPVETQMKFAEVRVRSLVARFRGRVTIWDAVNEPLWEPSPRHLAQRHWPHLETTQEMADYIEPVLRWCREEDPDACFLVNDYGLEADRNPPVARDGSVVTAARQRQRFLALAEELKRRGAAPSALGMQAHTGGWIDHATQWAIYEELAQAGLPLHVTEFWAHTKELVKAGLPAEEAACLQTDYVCDYLTVAFGHPAIEGFFFWGMLGTAVDFGEHSAHELTPLFGRLRRLLREEWMTRTTIRTDADGRAEFRGFFGDYSLRRRTAGGLVEGVSFRVDRQAAMPLTVTL